MIKVCKRFKFFMLNIRCNREFYLPKPQPKPTSFQRVCINSYSYFDACDNCANVLIYGQQNYV